MHEVGGPLLTNEAVLRAAHACYASVYADELEERGGSFPPGSEISRQVGRLPDEVQLPIAWRYLGRVEQGWGQDVGLVFHHMGLRDVEAQTTGLFLLLMSCMGHGVGLRDEWDAEFNRACEVLRINDSNEAPIHFEPQEWRELAEDRLGLRVEA